MATACTEASLLNLQSSSRSYDRFRERRATYPGPPQLDQAWPVPVRTGQSEAKGASGKGALQIFDAGESIAASQLRRSGLYDQALYGQAGSRGPYTPNQGVCSQTQGDALSRMFGPHPSTSAGAEGSSESLKGDQPAAAAAGAAAHGLASSTSKSSSSSDQAASGSPMATPQYSPFMMYPLGPPIQGYRSSDGAAGSPINVPGSPMSPGAVMMHPPFGNSSSLGAPGSPHAAYYPNPNPFGMHGGPANPYPTFPSEAPTAAQLPAFYVQAAAAAAAGLNGGGLGAGLPTGPFGAAAAAGMGLQPSLSGQFNQAMSALLQGYSAPLTLEQQLSHPGAMALDPGLASLGSLPPGSLGAAAAAALLQQQQRQHYLRPMASAHAGMLGFGGSGLLPHLQQAAAIQLSAAAASGLPASALVGHMSRLRVAHSADLTGLDGMGSMGLPRGNPSRFKPRKNSEPKIGPDGQPRLNARQRRTLRRARERALKGLLEVSQALLQKAEVPVKLPQDSHLSALMAAAEKEEKEKEEKEAAGYESPTDEGPSDAQPHSSADTKSPSNKSSSASRRDPAFPKGHELTAAVDKVEESVHNLAVAAVAAVAARYEGKDVSQAAVAAQAAAAAAVSATNVLPPGYAVPEDVHVSEDGTGSPGRRMSLPGGSDSLRGSTYSLPATAPVSVAGHKDHLVDAVASRSVDAQRGGAKSGLQGPGRRKSASADGGAASSAGHGKGRSSSSRGSSNNNGSQLESIDISGLISQLSSKKDEGMVDDKLIKDLEIIQSLIGALKAPIPGPSGPSRPPHKQHLSKRGALYGPVGSQPTLCAESTMSFPH